MKETTVIDSKVILENSKWPARDFFAVFFSMLKYFDVTPTRDTVAVTVTTTLLDTDASIGGDNGTIQYLALRAIAKKALQGAQGTFPARNRSYTTTIL